MVVSMFKLIATLTTLASALLAAPTSNVHAVDEWRVTHTGDSISAMAFGFVNGPGGVIIQGDTYRNLEHGRSAYVAGMGIPVGSGSTWQIAKLNISRTSPGGWAVIQDNSIDARSDWEWSKLMTDIVALTPDDVCLLGVFPSYRADINPELSARAARRATIMSQAFQQHPCRRFVFLNTYMAQNPSQFPDGQHPDATAQTWIRGQIIGSTR